MKNTFAALRLIAGVCDPDGSLRTAVEATHRRTPIAPEIDDMIDEEPAKPPVGKVRLDFDHTLTFGEFDDLSRTINSRAELRPSAGGPPGPRIGWKLEGGAMVPVNGCRFPFSPMRNGSRVIMHDGLRLALQFRFRDGRPGVVGFLTARDGTSPEWPPWAEAVLLVVGRVDEAKRAHTSSIDAGYVRRVLEVAEVCTSLRQELS